jgi:hypothetical protein
MARYNEILSGRFNKALQKIFSMKGEAPSPVVASEIIAVLPLFFGREGRVLEGCNTFGGGFIVTAVAGNISIIQISNPTNSKVMVVLEKISFAAVAAAIQNAIVNFGTSPSDLATVVSLTNYGLDIRGQVTPSSHLSTKNNTAAAPTGIVVFTSQTLANQGLEVLMTDTQELPMPPGTFYQFSTNAVNQPIGINLIWRERPLEDSELAF